MEKAKMEMITCRYSLPAQSLNMDTLYSINEAVKNYKKLGVDLLTAKHFVISGIVFMAFTIESFVNLLLSEKLPSDEWKKLERKLNWRGKINEIYKINDSMADWENAPLQLTSKVFELRNKLAHGKSESYIHSVPTGAPPPLFRPDWYEKITIDWFLDEAFPLFREVMKALSVTCGHKPEYYWRRLGIELNDK